MDKLNTHNVNRQILDLWKSQAHGTTSLLPVFYPDLVKHSLLFVGLNPSFNRSGIVKNLKDTKYKSIEPDDFFSIRNLSEDIIKQVSDIHNIAKTKYRYFARFKELANATNLSWEHIDTFFVRITGEKRIKSARNEAPDFFKHQCDLSIQLLKEVSPKVIVVENAYASEILYKKLSLDEHDFDPDIGTYRLKNDNTPIFFSGMLTGQRALDNGTFERLQWHIKFVMQKDGITSI